MERQIIRGMEYTTQNVIDVMKEKRVPEHSLAVGGFTTFCHYLGLAVMDSLGKPIVSVNDFGSVLSAIRGHDVRFLGSTLIKPKLLDAKVLAAKASQLAGLPYPETWLFVNGLPLCLHPGRPLINNRTDKAYVKNLYTHSGQGLIAGLEFNVDEFKPNGLGSIIYMQGVSTGDRSWDTRFVYNPYTRAVPLTFCRKSDHKWFSNVATGGEIIDRVFDADFMARKILPFLDKVDRAMTISTLADTWGEDQVGNVLELYQANGIKPTFGMRSIDVIFPKPWNPDQNPTEHPFVCETHQRYQVLSSERTQRLVDHVIEYAGRSVLITYGEPITPSDELQEYSTRLN